LVEPENKRISIMRQCELLGLNRTSLYYRRRGQSEEDAVLMRLLDEQYTETPFYGYRRMTRFLQAKGDVVTHKRVFSFDEKTWFGSDLSEAGFIKAGQSTLAVSVSFERSG
jgi:hypothetical protein